MTAWGVLFYTFGVLLPSLEVQLQISRSRLTAAFALGSLVCGLVSPTVGRWLDRQGSRRVMTVGSLLGFTALLAWAWAESLPALVLAFLAVGVAQALAFYDAAFAGLTRWIPDPTQRTRALLLVTFFGGLASTVFMPATAWLNEAYGVRPTLLVLAGIFLAVTLPAFALLPPHPAPHAAPGPARAVGPRRGFGWLIATFACQTAFAGVIIVHLAPLLAEMGDRSPARAATLAGLFGLFQVAARLGVGPWLARLPARWRITVLQLTQLSAALLLLLAQADAAAIAFAVLFGAANGLITIARPITLAEWVDSAGFGAASGRIARAAIVARSLAPFAAAGLHDRFGGYGSVLTLLGGLALLGAFLGWWAEHIRGAEPEAAAPPAETAPEST